MNKNLANFLLIAFLGLTFIFTGILTATEPPDDLMIENQGYKSDRKGPIEFTHLNHSMDYEVACKECHHEYKDGENVWQEGDPVKKCVECHNPIKNEAKTKKLSIAFHKNCKGCHLALLKEEISDSAPYKKCTDCHERKS